MARAQTFSVRSLCKINERTTTFSYTRNGKGNRGSSRSISRFCLSGELVCKRFRGVCLLCSRGKPDAWIPLQQKYVRWQRRFGHLGPRKLKNLHVITRGLDKPIPCKRRPEGCEEYLAASVKKHDRRPSGERASRSLQRILMDIRDPFEEGFEGVKWFVMILEDYRMSWTIPVVSREYAPAALEKWRYEVEHEVDLQLGDKDKTAHVFAVRANDAQELKSVLQMWQDNCELDHVELTVPDSSHQNGPAKRGIQYMEYLMRAMLRWARLPNGALGRCNTHCSHPQSCRDSMQFAGGR